MSADYVLYDYFKNKFEKELEIFGRRKLEYENDILGEQIDRVAKQCETNSASTKESCEVYTMDPGKFVEIVRTDQKIRSLVKLRS